MSDPMMRCSGSDGGTKLRSDSGTLFSPDPSPLTPAPSSPPLFGTQHAAAQAAARSTKDRYARILELLRQHGELSLPDLCQIMGVFPNQISGRLTELCQDGLIEPTGRTKRNPQTGSPCTIYRLRPHPLPPNPEP